MPHHITTLTSEPPPDLPAEPPPDLPADPELVAFLDSLVWEDWEPRVAPARDPVTSPFDIQIMPPSSVLAAPAAPVAALAEVDPTLQTVIRAWPGLTPEARAHILNLIRPADAAAARSR